MNTRGGFTIVELIITVTIMAILMTLAVVNLESNLAKSRDEERKTDVSNIVIFQETLYNRSSTSSYLHTGTLASNNAIETAYENIDRNNLRAPDAASGSYSLVAATNNTQTAAGVRPIPTNTTYVYQPIQSDGSLCTTAGACRKFNIYYREESTGTIIMMTSRSQ